MGKKLFIRPSQIVKGDECMWAMYLQYIAGIKTRARSANLVFGTIVHEAVTKYLVSLFAGLNFDPEKHFLFKWQEAMETLEIAYNASFGPEDLKATGERLCGDFPKAWDESGLVPLIDDEGPVLERTLKVEILPGIVLTGTPDIVAMNCEAEIVVPDFKTPASASPEEFFLISDQLTAYQILVEASKIKFGIERVDGLGYMELLKKKVPKTSRGEGPKVLPPAYGPRRSDQAIQAFIQKVGWIAEDINRGRFPKRPRMAYNTPCSLCSFQGMCLKGDTEGLIIPEGCQLPQAA
jgi:hypothetical protein